MNQRANDSGNRGSKRKADLTIEAFRFDQFREKTPLETIQHIFAHVEAQSLKARSWYWASIRVKRISSTVARALAYAAAVAGTTAPVVAAIWADAQERLLATQLGVVAWVVAGLVMLGDRVFGWSSGWLRYVSTVLAMERLTQQFNLDWAAYLIAKGTEPLTLTDAKALFDLARRYLGDLDARVKEETDGWVAEFNTGMSELTETLKTQRENAEKARAEAETTANALTEAQKSGAVSVNIDLDAPGTALRIELSGPDDVVAELVGESWAKHDLDPGTYTLRVIANHGKPTAVEASKVVEILGGKTTQVEIELTIAPPAPLPA